MKNFSKLLKSLKNEFPEIEYKTIKEGDDKFEMINKYKHNKNVMLFLFQGTDEIYDMIHRFSKSGYEPDFTLFFNNRRFECRFDDLEEKITISQIVEGIKASVEKSEEK